MSTTTKAPPRPLALSRDRDGWWLNSAAITPDEPRWGPYASKAEAAEARRSYLRNNINSLSPGEIKSEWRGKRRRAK